MYVCLSVSACLSVCLCVRMYLRTYVRIHVYISIRIYSILLQLPVLLEQEDMAFMPNNMPTDDNDHLQSITDDNIANKVIYCYW